MSRIKKNKGLKKKSILKIILFLFIIGLSFFSVINLDIFSIKTVLVENNNVFTEEDIIQMSGVIFGINTFKIKTKDISERILAHPYIKEVKIKRQLPDKISIVVEERKEAAIVFFLDRCIVLDDEGYALKTVDSNPYLTIIEGLNIEDFTIGEKLEVNNQKTFEDALKVIKSMDENDLFFKRITVTDDQLVVSIYDKLVLKAKSEIIISNMKAIGKLIYELHKDGIKRGTILVLDNGYLSYSPVEHGR